MLLWRQVPKEITKKPNKYRVKSSLDLQSKFELQQEAKKKAETEATHKNKERGEEKVMVSYKVHPTLNLQYQKSRHG